MSTKAMSSATKKDDKTTASGEFVRLRSDRAKPVNEKPGGHRVRTAKEQYQDRG